MTTVLKGSLDAEPILKYSFLLIKWIFIVAYMVGGWIVLFIFYSLAGSSDGSGSSHTNTNSNNEPCWGNANGNCPDHILGDIHQQPYWDHK